MTDVIITQADASAIVVTENNPNIVTTYQSGPQGISAYQVAVSNGFIGTESQWLDTLQGNISDVVLTKTVSEIADMSINFTNKLTVGSIITSINSVSGTPSGLTITNQSFSSQSVSFKVTGGTQLQGYRIDISIETSLNATVVASIHLLII